eukprot:15459584-Alexandrium_andersonii.AAC.1
MTARDSIIVSSHFLPWLERAFTRQDFGVDVHMPVQLDLRIPSCVKRTMPVEPEPYAKPCELSVQAWRELIDKHASTSFLEV